MAWIGVRNIDKLYAYVKKSGWDQITEVTPPLPWGGRICYVTTIDGCVIQFSE